MISLQNETVFPVCQIGDHLPPIRNGKKVHATTGLRWASEGLETIRIGRTLCTSVEALQRFCERASGQPAEAAVNSATSANSTHVSEAETNPAKTPRKRQLAKVDRELAKLGF